MTLPNTKITPIPDTEPDAVPSLWNVRYDEIDENFGNLDQRTESIEGEVQTARGGKSSLDSRLDEMQTSIEGLDPDMQNALIATVSAAMDAGGLAMRELQRWKNVRIQEGEITIENRGVINGCTVSASTTARNLDLAGGSFFAHGREYTAEDEAGAASVPSNTGTGSAVCYAYLIVDGNGEVQCNCSNLDEEIPADGIEIARLTVPAGNTELTDPNLANVTITDTRRLEPLWPIVAENPAFEYIPLAYILPDAEYAVMTEVVSYQGGIYQVGELLVQDRLKNGFKLLLAGTADTVKIRYAVRRVNI